MMKSGMNKYENLIVAISVWYSTQYNCFLLANKSYTKKHKKFIDESSMIYNFFDQHL